MINSSETIVFNKQGFDGKKYISLQKEKIFERISKFSGKLYLEIGGKFLFDAHASRVLPGFFPDSKKIIFSDLKKDFDIFFCTNADDINSNRQITNEDIDYIDYTLKILKDIEGNLGIKPKVVINKIDIKNTEVKLDLFRNKILSLGYQVFNRYKIDGYPNDVNRVLSDYGFGKDDYIKTDKKLILVTGMASSSGKMSTCLGQIYLDYLNGIDSGYAKYETFPVWNIDLNHPVNLAYEAATADIGDYNMYDKFHKKSYGIDSVNYNRDIEAFVILKSILDKFILEGNYMSTYKSPTDMGISNAGFCIIDDEICSVASLEEIKRRIIWYKELVDRGEGKINWVEKCKDLEKKCLKYIEDKSNGK
ncbi:MAG: DUF1846 family protein [Candidatus Gracilibacteria bacterium]|nr:DUF1846 family protein [Candidatus Gracilibacteria bacterium]